MVTVVLTLITCFTLSSGALRARAHSAPSGLRAPSIVLRPCADRLTLRPKVPALDGVRIKLDPRIAVREVERGRDPTWIARALADSAREPIPLGESRFGHPAYVLIVESPAVSRPRRVELFWSSGSVTVDRVAALDPVADRSFARDFETHALVRGTRHAFTIAADVLAAAHADGVTVRDIDEALAQPISPPVAHGSTPERIWLIGHSRAHAFLGIEFTAAYGVAHVRRISVATKLERAAFLNQSGTVHDDPAAQIITVETGRLAGRMLRFSAGVQAKLASSGIPRSAIAEAAREAVGLAPDSKAPVGRRRWWFAAELSDGRVLSVSVGEDPDGSLVIVHANWTTPATLRTCRISSHNEIR